MLTNANKFDKLNKSPQEETVWTKSWAKNKLKKSLKKSLTMRKRCDIIVKHLTQGNLLKSAKATRCQTFREKAMISLQKQTSSIKRANYKLFSVSLQRNWETCFSKKIICNGSAPPRLWDLENWTMITKTKPLKF